MPIAFKAIRDTGKVIDAAATQAALRNQMKVYCEELIHKAQAEYDRIPEGPNYVRKYRGGGSRPIGVSFTGRKRRSDFKRGRGVGVGGGWHSSVSSDGTSGEVYNDVPYAGYVQSEAHQSFNNKQRGWRTIEFIARSTSRVFQERMQIAINQGIAKARQNRTRTGQFTEGFG